jgi:hypothetical protein
MLSRSSMKRLSVNFVPFKCQIVSISRALSEDGGTCHHSSRKLLNLWALAARHDAACKHFHIVFSPFSFTHCDKTVNIYFYLLRFLKKIFNRGILVNLPPVNSEWSNNTECLFSLINVSERSRWHLAKGVVEAPSKFALSWTGLTGSARRNEGLRGRRGDICINSFQLSVAFLI